MLIGADRYERKPGGPGTGRASMRGTELTQRRDRVRNRATLSASLLVRFALESQLLPAFPVRRDDTDIVGLQTLVKYFRRMLVAAQSDGEMSFIKKSIRCIGMLAIGSLLVCGNDVTVYSQVDPRAEPLLQLTDLIYQGSFRTPAGAPPGYAGGLDYGGTAIAFNPNNNSLFLVGHDWYQLSAEITIPATLSRDANALPNSAFIQPLTDALEGKIRRVTDSTNIVKIGGQLVYRGKLYITDYAYYDGNGSQQLSHFYRPLNLGVQGQVQGPFRVGPLGAGFYDGFFSLIPTEWQSALGGPVLNGNCCLSIISRTSFGPSAFAIDPENIGVNQNAVSLLYYTSDHDEGSFDGNSTQVFGAVFPNGSRSILFFGRQGLGRPCYGEGTSDRPWTDKQ